MKRASTTATAAPVKTSTAAAPVRTSAAAAAPVKTEEEFGRENEAGLNEDQLRALRLVQGRRSIFVTGPGGSGKSHLLAAMKRWATYKKIPFAVTATTGVAALNVGGVTLHSWGGINLGKESVEALVTKIRSSAGKGGSQARGNSHNRWTKTQLLFIDEVSMLPSDLFAKLDHIGRALRYRHLVPFGGIQIVLFGDFLQLPPVERDRPQFPASATSYHHHHHSHSHSHDQADSKSASAVAAAAAAAAAAADVEKEQREDLERRYLFFSPSWQKAVHAVVLLRRVYRQSDDVFVALLGRARMGELTPADFRLLLTRQSKDPSRREKDKNGMDAPLLHPFRKAVDLENMRCLEELNGPLLRSNRRTHYVNVRRPPEGATTSAGAPLQPVVVQEAIMRADGEAQLAAKKLGDTITAPDPLLLKVGAAVMLLVNLDVKNKLVNGLRGQVIGTGQQAPALTNPPPPPQNNPKPALDAKSAAAPSAAKTKTDGANVAMDDGSAAASASAGAAATAEEIKAAEAAAEAAEVAAAKAWRKAMREREDAEQDAERSGVAAAASDFQVLNDEDEKIWIKFERVDSPVPISRYRWKQCLRDSERNLPEEKWTEYIQISQFPLMLAYAATVHKSQGLTLSAASLSLGEEMKMPGQSYTALSRLESLEGLSILRLSSKAFNVDQVTKCYYELLASTSPALEPVAPPITSAAAAAVVDDNVVMK